MSKHESSKAMVVRVRRAGVRLSMRATIAASGASIVQHGVEIPIRANFMDNTRTRRIGEWSKFHG
jgi:hypothetical protein